MAAPLFTAIVYYEEEGTDPFDSLERALGEYVRETAGEVGVVEWNPFCTGVGGHTYAQAVYADAAVPEPDRGAVGRAFGPLGQRMAEGRGTWRTGGEQVGWADCDFLYLLPDAAFATVQKLAAAGREPITMSSRTL